jgi:hypothetical protein
MGRMRMLLVAVVALATAGCGGSEAPSSDTAGQLLVEQTFIGDAHYVEGTKSYVSAEPENGGDTQEAELAYSDQASTGSLRLDPGRYTLKSWQRPCDGNCGYLDPPTDECSAPVEIAAGADTRVKIEVEPGKGCEIVVPR